MTVILVLQLLLTARPAARWAGSLPAGLVVAVASSIVVSGLAALLGSAASSPWRDADVSRAVVWRVVALRATALLVFLVVLGVLRERGGLGGGMTAGREALGGRLVPGLLPGLTGVDASVALLLAGRRWALRAGGEDPLEPWTALSGRVAHAFAALRSWAAERELDRAELRAAGAFDRWSMDWALAEQRLCRLDEAGQRCDAVFAGAYVSRWDPQGGELLPALFDAVPAAPPPEPQSPPCAEFERMLHRLEDLDG